MLFLPHPFDKKSYVEYCLQHVIKIINTLKNISDEIQPQEKPEWIKKYEFSEKKSLIKQKYEISLKIDKFEKYELLLYGFGIALENVVVLVLSELNAKVINQTKDKVDLIFETENKKFLAEIKGINKIATIKYISQLYRWVADELENEEKSIKPLKFLFICNTEREIEPGDRKEPFHEKTIDEAIKHEWGLLSTLELFHALEKIINNELSKDQIRIALEEQVGVIKFTN